MTKDRVIKEYFKLKDNGKGKTHLKCELYYDLGGINYFTYQNEGRGYYVSVTPVERGEYFESATAFTGYKQLVQPCSRKSKKQQGAAAEKYSEVRDKLIEQVLIEQGLELLEKIA